MTDKSTDSNFVYHKSEKSENKHLKTRDLIILLVMIFSLMMSITLIIIRQFNQDIFLNYMGLRVMLYLSVSLFIICFIYQIITKLMKKEK